MLQQTQLAFDFKLQVNRCAVCLKRSDQCCQLCKTTFYCTREHQRQDWKSHMYVCKYKQQHKDKQDDIITHTEEPKQKQPASQFTFAIKEQPTFPQPFDARIVQQKSQSNTLTYHTQKTIKRRKGQRATIIFSLLSGELKNAQLIVKRLVKLSLSLSESLTPQIIRELAQRYNIKTGKTAETIEYLFDVLLELRVAEKCDSRNQIKRIIQTLKFPSIGTYRQSTQTKNDIIQYNRWCEQVSRLCAVIKSMVLITEKVGLVDLSEFLMMKYVEVVRGTDKQMDVATAYFDMASLCLKNGRLILAQQWLCKCKSIRQKYSQNLPLSDVYFNLAIVNLQNKRKAMQLFKKSLEMRRYWIQKGIQRLGYTAHLEHLGKLHMEIGQFKPCFEYWQECLEIRVKYMKKDCLDIKRMQILIVFLYNTLVDTLVQTGQLYTDNELKQICQQITAKYLMTDQFVNYQIRTEIIKVEKLYLQTTQEFFGILDPKQTAEYQNLIVKLAKMTKQNGIRYVLESSFFQKLPGQKKRFLLALNPDLKI